MQNKKRSQFDTVVEDTSLLQRSWAASIPSCLIEKTHTPQERWDIHGSVKKVCASAELLDIVRNFPGTQTLTSRVAVESESFDHAIQTVQALKWVCFIFPRARLEQPDSRIVIQTLSPILNDLLLRLDPLQLSHRTKHDVVEALLAVPENDGTWERKLSIISQFLDKNAALHLEAELILKKSQWLRLKGEYRESEDVIHLFCCGCNSPSSGCMSGFFLNNNEKESRVNAIYGLLHSSHLENLIQWERYNDALQEIDDWKTPGLQAIYAAILPYRTLTAAKIFRTLGDLHGAKQRLEACFNGLPVYHSLFHLILCQLTDTYCDLRLNPELAMKIMAAHVDRYRKERPKTKTLRRILVSLVDVHLQKGRHLEAQMVIDEISSTYRISKPKNVSDELLHLRVLIAAARTSYLRGDPSSAVILWQEVLHYLKESISFLKNGFTYGVAQLSCGLAYQDLDRFNEAQECFTKGQHILDNGQPDYWIPSLQHWSDYILDVTKSRRECTLHQNHYSIDGPI